MEFETYTKYKNWISLNQLSRIFANLLISLLWRALALEPNELPLPWEIFNLPVNCTSQSGVSRQARSLMSKASFGLIQTVVWACSVQIDKRVITERSLRLWLRFLRPTPLRLCDTPAIIWGGVSWTFSTTFSFVFISLGIVETPIVFFIEQLWALDLKCRRLEAAPTTVSQFFVWN